ncbi:MAG: adenylyl-sulfate kinase [Gammaproteobacteria bacterium]|nr:adenylyl-sulfate kinase [Gammaproteobacteria bacterium]
MGEPIQWQGIGSAWSDPSGKPARFQSSSEQAKDPAGNRRHPRQACDDSFLLNPRRPGRGLRGSSAGAEPRPNGRTARIRLARRPRSLGELSRMKQENQPHARPDRRARPEEGDGREGVCFVIFGPEAGKPTPLGQFLCRSVHGPDGPFEGAKGEAIGRARCHLETERRTLVAIDTPDYVQYVRAMTAGEARADLAVLLVNAREGILPRTRHHGYLASLMGIDQVVLAVDRIDGAEDDEGAFSAIVEAFHGLADSLGIEQRGSIPMATRTGGNVFEASGNIPWYRGPTFVEMIETLELRAQGQATKATPVPEPAHQFSAHILWKDAQPMLPGRHYGARFPDASAVVHVTDLVRQINPDTLEGMAAKTLGTGEIGYCKLMLDQSLPLGVSAGHDRTGMFVLTDRRTGAAVGAGIIGFALRRAHNIVWQELKVDRAARAQALGQQPCVLWMTGLSGSGKSTIADRLEQELQAQGRHTYLLDGDNVRHGLSKDLGFTDHDRIENIRRVLEVSKLMVDAGLIVIVSFISPFRSERQMVRDSMEAGQFLEIFIDTPLEVCEARDPKGLYAKARQGDLVNFTGIDSPYEPPENPELRIDTTELAVEQAVDEIVQLLDSRIHAATPTAEGPPGAQPTHPA